MFYGFKIIKKETVNHQYCFLTTYYPIKYNKFKSDAKVYNFMGRR